MAHFAKINEDNIVEQVLVVPNEQEHRGQEYLNELGFQGTWIQTSFNQNIRNIFAYPGCQYLPDRDIFCNPKIYPSWSFDDKILDWVSPAPAPDFDYEIEQLEWDEDSLSWKVVPLDSNSL